MNILEQLKRALQEVDNTLKFFEDSIISLKNYKAILLEEIERFNPDPTPSDVING